MPARQAELQRGPEQASRELVPWSASQRAGLIAEILRAYALTRRALRREPIGAVLATLRAQAPSAAGANTTGDGRSTLGDDRGMLGDDRRTLDEACHLGRAVVRTLSLLPGDTRCLVRSLVLTRLLARRGISTRLVIGARSAPTFVAHAWVEYLGSPVLSPGDDSFGRLVEL